MLIKVDASGAIVEEIAIPAELAAQSSRFGFEGVAVTGSGADDETVWLAVQREWKDDPKGLAKRLAYKPGSKSCGAVHYPLDKTETGWVGLSEITSVPNGFVVIERDNQIGQAAKIKKLSFIVGAELVSSPLGSSLPVVKKNELRDLLPDLKAHGGFVLDKVESFAIDIDGNAFVITDNDGVDDHPARLNFSTLAYSISQCDSRSSKLFGAAPSSWSCVGHLCGT